MRRPSRRKSKLHRLKDKLNAAGCLFNWNEKVILAAWDCPLEEELREFKEEFKFTVQYEIR